MTDLCARIKLGRRVKEGAVRRVIASCRSVRFPARNQSSQGPYARSAGRRRRSLVHDWMHGSVEHGGSRPGLIRADTDTFTD
jgi:hypothetical protein